MNGRNFLFLVALTLAGFFFTGCETLPLPQTQSIRSDTHVLWVALENYVQKHPQMNHSQLSRVTVNDVIKSGQLGAGTVSEWTRKGFEISIHPENFRAPGDGVVCQMNDRNAIVFATRTGEIKGCFY